MEPRNIRRDKTGCLLAALLSMAFAEGCGPASEEGSRRGGNARTALVASVPPQAGQAFLVGVFMPSLTEGQSLRNALQQAAQSNHLELDVQLWEADRAAQAAHLNRWQAKRADALLVCVNPSVDIKPLLRDLADRQIPVVVAEWEESKTAGAPVVPASASAVSMATGKKPAVPAMLPNVVLPLKPGQYKHPASLTLFHNGKSTRQQISATPSELAERAVAVVSAYLRGEKVTAAHK